VISVIYELADLGGKALDIKEDRGRIVLRIGDHLSPQEIVSVLNEGSKQILAGGHWFQEWKGEIIAADPHPERRFPRQRHLRDASKPETNLPDSRPDAAAS
jgi:hypothetical protein